MMYDVWRVIVIYHMTYHRYRFSSGLIPASTFKWAQTGIAFQVNPAPKLCVATFSAIDSAHIVLITAWAHTGIDFMKSGLKPVSIF